MNKMGKNLIENRLFSSHNDGIYQQAVSFLVQWQVLYRKSPCSPQQVLQWTGSWASPSNLSLQSARPFRFPGSESGLDCCPGISLPERVIFVDSILYQTNRVSVSSFQCEPFFSTNSLSRCGQRTVRLPSFSHHIWKNGNSFGILVLIELEN